MCISAARPIRSIGASFRPAHVGSCGPEFDVLAAQSSAPLSSKPERLPTAGFGKMAKGISVSTMSLLLHLNRVRRPALLNSHSRRTAGQADAEKVACPLRVHCSA